MKSPQRRHWNQIALFLVLEAVEGSGIQKMYTGSKILILWFDELDIITAVKVIDSRDINPAFKRSLSSSSVDSSQGSHLTSESTAFMPCCKVSALHWREAICFGTTLGPSTDMISEARGTRGATSSLRALTKACWNLKHHNVCSKLSVGPADLWHRSNDDKCSCEVGFFFPSIASGSESTQASPPLGCRVPYQTAKMASSGHQMPSKSQKCGFAKNLKITSKVRTEPTYFYGILRVLYGYLREVNLRGGHIRDILRAFTGYTVDYGLPFWWVS